MTGCAESEGQGVSDVPGDKVLSEGERREIFRALVEVQDQGAGVVRSRQLVAERFGLGEGQVRRIEDEGIRRDWLDE